MEEIGVESALVEQCRALFSASGHESQASISPAALCPRLARIIAVCVCVLACSRVAVCAMSLFYFAGVGARCGGVGTR